MKELGAEAFPLLRKAAGADDLTPQASFGKAQVTSLLVILFQQIPGSDLMLRRGRPREKPEKATVEVTRVIEISNLEIRCHVLRHVQLSKLDSHKNDTIYSVHLLTKTLVWVPGASLAPAEGWTDFGASRK